MSPTSGPLTTERRRTRSTWLPRKANSTSTRQPWTSSLPCAIACMACGLSRILFSFQMQGWRLAWKMRLLNFASNPLQKKMPASSWLPPSSRTSVPCGMVKCLCAAPGSVRWSRTTAEVPILQSTLRGSGSVLLSVISTTTPSCSAVRGNVAEPKTATGNSRIAYIGVILVFTHILPKEDLEFPPQPGRVEGLLGPSTKPFLKVEQPLP